MEKIVAECDGQKIPVTFSVGYADCQRGQNPQELLDEADRALYMHKQSVKREAPVPEAVKR
jgi:PleD family two-component response regulator